MLKLLLHLWWTQKKRNFSWREMLVEVYGYVACAGGAIVGLIGSGLTWADLRDADCSPYAMVVVALLVPVDILVKALMKKEATVMDDYLRTRPIPRHAWNRFLLTVNMLDYWTWAVPILIALMALVVVPMPVSLLVIAASLSASVVAAMALTCCRRAYSWLKRLPMVAVLLLFAAGAVVYAFLVIARLAPVWQLVVFIALNAVATALLYLYLSRLHCYDSHTVRTQRVRAIDVASRFALDRACLWRAPRIRNMALVFTALMVADTYLVQTGPDAGLKGDCIILFTTCLPSLLLAQWTFGVEANFFHGLWTKPVSVIRLLMNKFHFFIAINALTALLLVPLVVMGSLDALKLLAMYVYSVGVVNLMCMPTCLFSPRVDLFSSSFFNYQGNSMKLSVYSILCLVPIALVAVLYYLLPAATVSVVLLVLGTVGLAVHPLVLRGLARAYVNRRYERFEAYMK